MKENRRLNPRWRLSDMSMERRLLLVFIIIIICPLSVISLISYNSYSRSIQKNTVLYSRNMIDQMMERVDDYIEDMKRISSIPAYIDDIKLNLVRSNQYHEQREQLIGKDGGGSLPKYGYVNDSGFLPVDITQSPALPQFQEFLSYNPQFVESVQQSDPLIELSIKAGISFWSGDYIQELIAAPDLKQAFAELNSRWKLARNKSKI